MSSSSRNSTLSYWLATSGMMQFPPLGRDLDVDVLVIGGGITGITAAYLICKAGRKVALVDRGRLGYGDTGHTTAHLTYVTDIELSALVKRFGKDHAHATWDAGRAAMEQITEIARAESISCDLKQVPAYLHCSIHDSKNRHAKKLAEEAELAHSLGFDARFLDSVPVTGKPGVVFSNQAKFHPLKYLGGLVRQLSMSGCEILEKTEITEITENPLSAKAGHHTIRFRYLVIATHVPLIGVSGLTGAALFQTKLAPYTSYAIGAKAPAGSVPEALFWDTTDPYYYLRVERHPDHDYLVFGGKDHKTGQVEATFEQYEKLAQALSSYAAGFEIVHRWSGQVWGTNDGLPYIGETSDSQFVATGFHGNGMTFGTFSGMMACDAVLGKKNPWSELFTPGRKKLGSAWDYIKENVDYPYYMVRDRLRSAEGTHPAELRPGEGRVLKMGGKRVAAYRSEKGEIALLSAVCTHMGCLVHWNEADKSWDCPCHGSRFDAQGAVLGGPAESPLERLTLEELSGGELPPGRQMSEKHTAHTPEVPPPRDEPARKDAPRRPEDISGRS